MVEVSPGSIRQFAKLVDELAEQWNEPTFPMVQFTKIKDEKPHEYPFYGSEFEAGTSVQQRYDSTYSAMVKLVSDAYGVLKGLAAASDKIADKYQTAAEKANAKVSDIQKIMDEYVNPQPDSPPGSGNPTGS